MHTPGPWICADGDSTSFFIYDDKGEDGYIGAIAEVTHADPDELAANARLIAAAPDLLEALLECERVLSDLSSTAQTGTRTRAAFNKARAALAKVGG